MLRTRGRCCFAFLYLLYFLVGHYRTFHWTQHGIHAMARLSSDDCYMAAAVMPEEVCSPHATLRYKDGQPMCSRPRFHAKEHAWQTIDWRLFASSIDDTPALLRRANDIFKGKLTFGVVRRTGTILSEHPAALYPLWQLAWGIAAWSSRRHGFATPPNAVVIRTRPEAIFNAPFSLRPLMHFFHTGLHGLHVVLTQNTPTPSVRLSPDCGMIMIVHHIASSCSVCHHCGLCYLPRSTVALSLVYVPLLTRDCPTFQSQSDVFLITSWACYANDIARPLEHNLSFVRGKDAGWGSSFQSKRRRERCICLNQSLTAAECDTPPSCVPISVESPFLIPSRSGLLRYAPQACCRSSQEFSTPRELLHSMALAQFGLYFNSSQRIELSEGVRCYCGQDGLGGPAAPAADDDSIPRMLETLNVPWISHGYRRCLQPQPLGQLPSPWCACGMDAAFNGKVDMSCTRRTTTHHGLWKNTGSMVGGNEERSTPEEWSRQQSPSTRVARISRHG